MAATADAGSVEPIVRKTAEWAWRLLVILGAVVAVLWAIDRLEVIVVPVLLALMLSALLVPAVDFLDRRGAPRGGAVALVLLSGFALLGGIMTFVVSQFVVGLPSLVDQVARSIDSTRRWLTEGPAHLSRQQIDNAGNAALIIGGRPMRPLDLDLRWVAALCYRNNVIEESGVAAAVGASMTRAATSSR